MPQGKAAGADLIHREGTLASAKPNANASNHRTLGPSQSSGEPSPGQSEASVSKHKKPSGENTGKNGKRVSIKFKNKKEANTPRRGFPTEGMRRYPDPGQGGIPEGQRQPWRLP